MRIRAYAFMPLRRIGMNVRSLAAETLRELGEHANEAIPALTKYLEHQDGVVRKWAAITLGKLGEHANEAIPALTKCAFEDRDDDVRRSAADALAKLSEHPAKRRRIEGNF